MAHKEKPPCKDFRSSAIELYSVMLIYKIKFSTNIQLYQTTGAKTPPVWGEPQEMEASALLNTGCERQNANLNTKYD